jgi:hypothetical protein
MSDDELDLRNLPNIIDNILLVVATMINDFHFDTRCGDIMMEQLSYYIYEISDHANIANISCEFENYESTESYTEWINLSKIQNKDERLVKAITLLKNVLFDISYSLDENFEKNIKLCSEMCKNILLLHTIIGTLDLCYNKIEKIIDVLSERQIKLLSTRSISRLS